MSERIERYAKLHVPDWLSGGNPKGLIDGSRLVSRRDRQQESRAWSVQTEESYYRRSPDLFNEMQLAGPGCTEPQLEALQTKLPRPGLSPSEWVINRVNEIGAQLEETGDVSLALIHAKLALVASPHEQLSNVAASVFEQISDIPTAERPEDRPFAAARVHLVTHEIALLHRLKLASVWLRLEYDERLRSGEVTHLSKDPGETLAFASASHLYSGMLTMDAYFAPLMGCVSPFLWGLLVPREGGNIILSLGTTINGTRREAAELLQTLGTQSGTQGVTRPKVVDEAFPVVIRWWTDALNNLFGVLSDLSVFVDHEGFYLPAAHLHALLTVEQLFRRVVSIQAAHRDADARRVLLFTVLDTLQRLTGRPLEKHCSLSHAENTLAHLDHALPEEASQLLLPRARDGVQALRDMQRGFFLNDEDFVPVPHDKERSVKKLDLDAAVAHYIKVLRDATHGYGSNKENAVGKTNALLAHHTGDIPHELGWLGYLYLLDVLSRPEILRETLRSRTRKR